MKNFLDISEIEMERLRGKTVSVYEKLDMIYFRVHVGKGGSYEIFTSKGRSLDDVDRVLNSVYGDMFRLMEDIDTDYIYNEVGDVVIGLFYHPFKKTRSIAYEKFPVGTFIVSDYYTSDQSRRNDDVIRKAFGKCGGVVGIGEHIGPYITDVKVDSIDRSLSPEDAIQSIVTSTFTGNDVKETKGVVLRCGDKAWEIPIELDSVDFDFYTKVMYRDYLLENFIHTLTDDEIEGVLSSDSGYIEKICSLFMLYIDRTNFFKTNYFEDSDFVPVKDGYMGDIDYSMLPSTVSIICKRNNIYKNVLRVFLSAFRKPSFVRFDRDSRMKLEKISGRLNNKQY